MSAGIDLAITFTTVGSITAANGVGSSPASGEIVGVYGDLRDANMLTHLIVSFGQCLSGSFRVQAQTSSTTNSGDFTDPTSGLLRMPTNLLSGGILLVNSGTGNQSGNTVFGGFLRPADHRYVRARILSGDEANTPVHVSLGAWSKRTGIGPGYSQSPASGTSGSFGVGGF